MMSTGKAWVWSYWCFLDGNGKCYFKLLEKFKLQNIMQYIITQIILELLLQITLHIFPDLKCTSKLEAYLCPAPFS